jgi:toxin ParE1/3/4
MAEYRLSPAAERDLESIWLYSQAQWGLEQAHHYIDILSAMFDTLANSPKTAQACDDIRTGYRRKSVLQHVIYFRITSYGIAVMRILHGRMDAPRHL